MNFHQLLKDTLESIVKDTTAGHELTKFKAHIKEHGWPRSYSKSSAIEAIELLIAEELPDDPGGTLVDLLLGNKRTPIKFNKTQINLLEKFSKLITNAKESTCKHVNLGIAAFMHGGGFTMPVHIAELICKDCGLNITLSSDISIEAYKKDFGIVITKPALKKLSVWANNSKANSANGILRDPIGAYNNSVHWDKPIPLKIVDVKKLNLKSGI